MPTFYKLVFLEGLEHSKLLLNFRDPQIGGITILDLIYFSHFRNIKMNSTYQKRGRSGKRKYKSKSKGHNRRVFPERYPR